MGDTLSLDIRAEQLTTAYELAKDEGLHGDELNAVVVRHLRDLADNVPPRLGYELNLQFTRAWFAFGERLAARLGIAWPANTDLEPLVMAKIDDLERRADTAFMDAYRYFVDDMKAYIRRNIETSQEPTS